MDFKPQKDTLFAAGAAAEPETQASSGSKSANEFCKNQLGKLEDITKVQCSDKESSGDTLKGHCTKEGSCKVERICDKEGTCKAISEKSQAPCNPEMGGGACRKEWQDIISNYGKELDYYATEDVRAALREKIGGGLLDIEEGRYFVKGNGSYYNPFTGNEILKINETPDGKTITLFGPDGQETIVDRNADINTLREWVNDGDARMRYASLEDAFLGKRVDLSPLATEISKLPEINPSGLYPLRNDDQLVRMSGIAENMSFNRLQEIRSIGETAFNVQGLNQELQNLTSERLTYQINPALADFTGFRSPDTASALFTGLKDGGVTPNLLSMADLSERAELLNKGLRETLPSNFFDKLPTQRVYISLLGDYKGWAGAVTLTPVGNFLRMTEPSDAPGSSVFNTAMHELQHLIEGRVPINDASWLKNLYGDDAQSPYTSDWRNLPSPPKGMFDIYSAAKAAEHRANTFADMVSGTFQDRAARDPIYSKAVDEIAAWTNRISTGMDRAYFEKIAPAAERFNFQLNKIRARIRDLLR